MEALTDEQNKNVKETLDVVLPTNVSNYLWGQMNEVEALLKGKNNSVDKAVLLGRWQELNGIIKYILKS